MLLLVALSLAETRVSFAGGVAGAMGTSDPVSGAGGVSGGASVALAPDPSRGLVLEAHAREMIASGPGRTVGGIYVNVRWPAGAGPFLYGGFAHHHETGLEIVAHHPVETVGGFHSGIDHRSGFLVGAGWELPAPYTDPAFLARLRPVFRVDAEVLPGSVGPLAYLMAGISIHLAVGRMDSAPQ